MRLKPAEQLRCKPLWRYLCGTVAGLLVLMRGNGDRRVKPATIRMLSLADWAVLTEGGSTSYCPAPQCAAVPPNYYEELPVAEVARALNALEGTVNT
jgi:hypothetical protein